MENCKVEHFQTNTVDSISVEYFPGIFKISKKYLNFHIERFFLYIF